ncbi:uncharacterized protein LOC120637768 isoform X1 [Pararge aegeria]|uniref:uncharacterized protein LOC120637768 isoform X1 n=1 Tax=Pararge aegeria TaxID=116150 RepID=UPI0019D0755B|nr:uncharacterized protein LOC120637768 isoform X1 [Pararge aegeria]
MYNETYFYIFEMRLHQDNWKALCRSISVTCNGNTPNQSHCSHLVPLCVQRCQRGNLEPVSVLLSLLSKHQSNVKLFHECNGMSIFKGDFLRNEECLQLLNLVLESAKPHYREEVLEASELFRELRFNLNKYGLNSPIGQWVSVILFSHSKVVETNINVDTEEGNHKLGENSINETKNTVNETNELLCNVLKEAIGWQNQFGSNRFTNVFNQNYEVENINRQSSSSEHKIKVNDKLPHNAEYQRSDLFRFPAANYSKNDLSLSFLLKHNPKEPRLRKPKYMLRSDQFPIDDETFLHQSSLLKSYETSSRNNIDDTILNFNPPFVSTPKRNKYSNVKSLSKISLETNSIYPTSRDHSTFKKTIHHKRKLVNTTQTHKRLRNRSMSAKFLDILNGSCTTIIKGFKSIFASKKSSMNIDDRSKEVTINAATDNFCAYNFTKNVDQNVTLVQKKEDELTNITKEFSMQYSNFSSCNTCNDTFVLKHKFANDAFLQQTVKRLKMGINLYGCDFKKISRTMWPRETYMTPNVLYTLYRKLIIKQ